MLFQHVDNQSLCERAGFQKALIKFWWKICSVDVAKRTLDSRLNWVFSQKKKNLTYLTKYSLKYFDLFILLAFFYLRCHFLQPSLVVKMIIHVINIFWRCFWLVEFLCILFWWAAAVHLSMKKLMQSNKKKTELPHLKQFIVR